MYTRAAKAYKKTELNSASKAYILDRLYERMILDFDDAYKAIENKDVRARYDAINHACRIVTELKAALDFSVSKDLCENLNSLYNFVEDCLTSATQETNPNALKDAKAVIESLRLSFAEAAENADSPRF
jgi:flagellar protein FliS